MSHITKWDDFLLEFVETQRNTPLLYKDDNIEVKVAKTAKASKNQNKNTYWCSSSPGPFYAHNRTADMFRINFSDGYKLRLTWDFIQQEASELGAYSGGTHWGQGGIVDGKELYYDVLRPRDNEDPFNIDWQSDKKREIVDRIKMIPDDAVLKMMEYHEKSSREKSEILIDLYNKISKIKILSVEPGESYTSYDSFKVTVDYLNKKYEIELVIYKDHDYCFVKLGKLEKDLKNKYANFGKEISTYIRDKVVMFNKLK